MEYASLPIFKKALDSCNISFHTTKTTFYTTCELSKSHKQSFMSRTGYASIPLKVVHLDVLVTSIVSKNDHQYYVHFFRGI